MKIGLLGFSIQTANMKITELKFSKTTFDNIPEDERIFLTAIGHIQNEIIVLEKLLFLSTTFNHSNRSMDAINASQSLFISRLTAGKLWEGWELLKSFLVVNDNRPKYPISINANLSQDGLAAWDELKNYFSDSCLINVLRNQFAFHYMPGNLKKNPPESKDVDELEVVVTEKDEPFFTFSEEFIVKTILDKIDRHDHENAFTRMIEEVMRKAHTFKFLCNEYLLLFIIKYNLKYSETCQEFSDLEYNKKLAAPFLFSDYK